MWAAWITKKNCILIIYSYVFKGENVISIMPCILLTWDSRYSQHTIPLFFVECTTFAMLIDNLDFCCSFPVVLTPFAVNGSSFNVHIEWLSYN